VADGSSIVTQCKASRTACFVKQAGAHPIDGGKRWYLADRKGGDQSELPEDLRVRQFPNSTQVHSRT
jgi:hypothetical protein